MLVHHILKQLLKSTLVHQHRTLTEMNYRRSFQSYKQNRHFLGKIRNNTSEQKKARVKVKETRVYIDQL